jgi:hypothetical protein
VASQAAAVEGQRAGTGGGPSGSGGATGVRGTRRIGHGWKRRLASAQALIDALGTSVWAR